MPSHRLRWIEGTETEIHFWREWIAKDGKDYLGPRELEAYVTLRVSHPRASILDLGSGAWCRIGTFLPGHELEIVAADIFADHYMKAWRAAGMMPQIPIEKQDMTALSYPDERFDIVHCSNALDHTVNPFAAIFEMKRVCKRGGWVQIRYFKSVADRYSYTGLHQWNIAPKGHDVLIWSDRGAAERHWMSELLPGVSFSILPRSSGKPQRLVEWRKS